ncbi:MAG TPA: hypothetical protein VGC41_02965 [Kofleriaceae bacterium]
MTTGYAPGTWTSSTRTGSVADGQLGAAASNPWYVVVWVGSSAVMSVWTSTSENEEVG